MALSFGKYNNFFFKNFEHFFFFTRFFFIRNVRKYKNEYTEVKHLNNTEKDVKPINRSITDMDKFEKKGITKKKSFAKNTWHDCYNSPITVGGITDKGMSLFETNTTKNYSKPKRVKNVYGEEIFLNWEKKMKRSKTE